MIVNIRKRDGLVVDTGQHMDERFFENRDVPDGALPEVLGNKKFFIDPIDNTIKEKPRATLPLRLNYVLLMDREPYGQLHAHPNDQLVVVLAGAIGVVEDGQATPVAAPSSYLIAKGVQHLITGAQNYTLILTVQV